MKTIAIVLATFWVAGAAMADDSCTVQATAKNLHGAALNSFAKKCCKDQAAAQNFTAPRKKASLRNACPMPERRKHRQGWTWQGDARG